VTWDYTVQVCGHRIQRTAVIKCFANTCRSVYQLKEQSVRGSNLH